MDNINKNIVDIEFLAPQLTNLNKEIKILKSRTQEGDN